MNGRTQEDTDTRAHTEGLVPLVKRMVDSVEHLVEDHLELARLELAEDAKKLVKQGIEVGVFVPVMGAGFVVVLIGLGVLLGQAVGLWAGLLIVGGVALLGGALGAFAAYRRIKVNTSGMMDATRQEASETKDAVGQLSNGQRRLETHHAG